MKSSLSNLPRRKFLKSLGGAAVAGSIPNSLQSAISETFAHDQTVPLRAAIFWEIGFEAVDGCHISRDLLRQGLEGFQTTYLSEQDLLEGLTISAFDLLITPFGSAFPKRAWRSLLNYLREGGNWLNIGGVPFAVPINYAGTAWRAEERQVAYHKRIGITQSFPVRTIAGYEAAAGFDVVQLRNELTCETVYELYVRLTSTSDTSDEVGSDGPREAVLNPLVFAVNQKQRRVAAPVIQIDRLQGEFAGGRWVFANFSGSLTARIINLLAKAAAQGAIEFLAHTDFACYREHESPSLSIKVARPKGALDKLIHGDCRVEVRDSSGQVTSQLSVAIQGEGPLVTARGKLNPATGLAPGSYVVQSRLRLNSPTHSSSYELTYSSGFWVYDRALITRGKALTVDNHFFSRAGQVFPVTGTTYMASDVHRKFLFEPNPFLWDKDFRAMKDAGVNMVRTGIWTGWKKYMTDSGVVNDQVLRAFDAFLLTAHKYDLPVIFTFFAFLPETWGGSNAYLDPKAVRAQQQFVSTFAQRYREVNDLIWDLINEPSFCSPKHLWSCRPNYDDHEKDAWRLWLKERYQQKNTEALAATMQLLWRTTSDDSLALPQLEDFSDGNIFEARRPLKSIDYRLFAQDMFARWVRAMTQAIRSNGNPKQLITVGQDEAGLRDSPNPQFFTNTVDFTSMHHWWNNDDLVWDSVLAKTPAKANLLEETGIMFYEKTDGAAWRTEEEASNLLERKLAISFGADGAGFIEWIWNTNCYMNSDNEVAIGFHRVDQTAKPELEPFTVISKFVATHRDLLVEREAEEVLMVIPHSQMFSPRSFATEATRKCVRAFYYHCRIPLCAVGEYALSKSVVNAKMIVIPAPRVLSQDCWETVIARAERGATVIMSGIIDSDSHWLPVARGKQFGWTFDFEPVAESEFIVIGNREYLARFEGEKIQRIEKAVEKGSDNHPRVDVRPIGMGRLIWSPLPLEVSESFETLVAFYRFALGQAGLQSGFRVSPATPSVLVLPSLFARVVLYTFVSEANRSQEVRLSHLETRTLISLTVPAGKTALVLLDRRSGRLIDSTVPVH